jgi:hypothetical protein
MPDLLKIPPEDIAQAAWLSRLRQVARADLPTARRAALLRLLWQEAGLTRQGLIARIEDILWPGCFASAPASVFHGDLNFVRRRLADAGHQVRYSRRPDRPGYYLEGRLTLDPHLQRLISGAVAEVDPAQMAISGRLTPAQRFRQGYSMTRLAERVSTYRRQLSVQPGGSHPLLRERRSSEVTESADLDFGDFMRLVLDALEAAHVDYLIGGAVAVWAWGEARTTRDFDLVVNIPFENIPALSEELEKRNMLVPVEIILDLLVKPEGDLPINAIHLYTGYKAELFMLRPGDLFRQTALARRRLVDLGPPLGQVYVHAPEDLILNKLRYFSLSHQPKHTRDIASMLLALGDELDTDYLESWAARLGLLDLWREIFGNW